MTIAPAAKTLRSNFTWVLSGNILYSACQWGIVMVLAKLGSTVQVGEYALGVAITAPISLFANLQLRALVASDTRDEFTFGEYLTFRLATLGVAMLAIVGFAGFQPEANRGWIVALVGLSQLLEFVSDTFYGLMQKYERLDRISWSLMMKGPLSLAALGAAMYLTRSVVWAVAGQLMGRLLILLLWDARLSFTGATRETRLKMKPEWNSGMLRLLKSALPLGVISLLVSLNSNVPRYYIEAYCRSGELGIFSAIASLLSVGSLVVTAFGQSIFRPVAKACASSDQAHFRTFVMQAIALGVVLGGIGVAAAASFGREILSLVFQPEYGSRPDIFTGLMIAGTIAYMASGAGYVMTAARSLYPQIPLLLAALVTATVISSWSISKQGLSGAVDSALAASIVQMAGTAFILFRIDRQLGARQTCEYVGAERETA